MTNFRRLLVASLTCALGLPALPETARSEPGEGRRPGHAKKKPDILFVVMDDVGIDQLRTFGYGGNDPADIPNLDAIAAGGVRFSQTWAMPECSPSRSAFFTGRYPLRTGVMSAIVENHLPQTYLSPFEATTPRILERAGYASAMVGKYHLGDGNDPAGDCAPATRGWDFFRGNMNAGPPSIDSTAGGLVEEGGASCGFDRSEEEGACYFLRRRGRLVCRQFGLDQALLSGTPARACLERGGIFRTSLSCGTDAPTIPEFASHNGFYVWPRTTTPGPLSPLATDTCRGPVTSRSYMTTAQSDDAVQWWRGQTGPRMLTVSYNSIHTPYQPPPTSLAGPPVADDCEGPTVSRGLANLMLEAMDREIARLLASLGLARLDENGAIETLNLRNTMLVVVGDNGSFSAVVKADSGFDVLRSKGTVYETGVRVPLLVAGAGVNSPGRSVDHIVNVVDLFGLFADVAGVDLADAVPPAQPVDSKPLAPYLSESGTPAVRTTNFTQLAVGTFSPDPASRSWPCLLANRTCSDTVFPTQDFCEDNGGTWYGPGGDEVISSCCAVLEEVPGLGIGSIASFAMRDERFKLIESDRQDCETPLAPDATDKPFPWAEWATERVVELYDLTPDPNDNPAGIEMIDENLLDDCDEPSECLEGEALASYENLSAALDDLRHSADAQNDCARLGDGNLDLRVDALDVNGWQAFEGLGPSRYDIDVNGLTDSADLAIIQSNLDATCAMSNLTADAAAVPRR